MVPRNSYIMKKYHNYVVVFLLLAGLSACNPGTLLVRSWRDPSVTVDTAKIGRFVVAALLGNQTVRREVEDEMASRFPGKAVQSYREFGDGDLKESEDFYSSRLKEQGYDGIVLMRLVKEDEIVRYVPGSYPVYYRSWGHYWGYSWRTFYDPGFYTTDLAYEVEVNVYSLMHGRLIWTATTTTINPPDRDKIFREVGRIVYARMKKEGFLKL
jgi:hypothetical protein